MKSIRHKISLLAVIAVVLFAQACQDLPEAEVARTTAHAYDSKVYLEWDAQFLRLERYAKGYRPGPAPRAHAYLAFASYECAVPGIPENNSIASLYPDLNMPKLNSSDEINWAASINEVHFFLMQRFFFHMESEYPDLFAEIQQTYTKLNNEFAANSTPEVMERSKQWGLEVAKAVYDWESLDQKGHNAFLNAQPLSYSPPVGPGKWTPTIPDQSRAVFPYWGEVRTFAMREEDKLARPPIPYSEDPNSLFFSQAEEVYKTVNFTRASHTTDADKELAYDQRWMAIFWSDDLLNLTFSPPPRLVAIADQIVDAEKLDLAGAAELYAKLGLALHDNGVAIWKSKYFYNVERPSSYIRRVLPSVYPDAANWNTILDNPMNGVKGITPAFPAYPSGHSGFGGAGAKILSSFFEYTPSHPGTYGMTDNCHALRNDFLGSPRYFRSLTDMGREDAISRVPLGVHFRMDCDEGLRLGELAAQRVLELPWKK